MFQALNAVPESLDGSLTEIFFIWSSLLWIFDKSQESNTKIIFCEEITIKI